MTFNQLEYSQSPLLSSFTESRVENLSPAVGRGIDSRNRVWHWVDKLNRLAGRYDNPMPTWFLTHKVGLKLQDQESIPPAYVAPRTCMSNRVVVPAHQAGYLFLCSLKGLQIRALMSCTALFVDFWQLKNKLSVRQPFGNVKQENDNSLHCLYTSGDDDWEASSMMALQWRLFR